MKLYIIEYTAWTQGSRDAGHPYRTYKVTNDKVRALGFLKDRTTERRIWTGYDEPKFFDMEGVEVDVQDALNEYDNFERTKDAGGYI